MWSRATSHLVPEVSVADSVVPGGQVGRRKTEPHLTLALSERGKKSPRGLLNTLNAMSRKRRASCASSSCCTCTPLG